MAAGARCRYCADPPADGAPLCRACAEDVLGPEDAPGGFMIEGVLARGGFGITYIAKNPLAQSRRVVVKECFVRGYCQRAPGGAVVALPGQEENWRKYLAAFLAEADTLAKLSEQRPPTIVWMNDVFRDHDTAYIVLEFVHGPTLRSELDGSPGGLPEEKVRATGDDLVQALRILHKEGRAHLDVHAGNAIRRRDGRTILIDFGASVAGPRPIAGPPTCAPPEMGMPEAEVGPHTDVFELSVLLYELLTGASLPEPSTWVKKKNQPKPPLGGRVPPWWRGLLESGLIHDWTKRPSDVEAWWRENLPTPPAAGLITPPLPDPTPAAARPALLHELRVDPAGKGTHSTLAEAIAAAAPGATIRLSADHHALAEGLTLTKPLTLIGQGIESSTVSAARGRFVLRLEGGPHRWQGFTVRWLGDDPGDAVVVDNAEIALEGCRFTGARASAAAERSGLAIVGSTKGEVTRCAATGNGGHGIALTDVGPDLILRRNTCDENGTGGIVVGGRAAPTLDRNTCRRNEHGIVCTGTAGPHVVGNTCERNVRHGVLVLVEAEATLRLEENRCRLNGASGIAFVGNSRGSSTRDVCRQNLDGISVEENAAPVVAYPSCVENTRYGLYLPGGTPRIYGERLVENRKAPRGP